MPDYAIANERVWPTANDVHDTSGSGKKLLELQLTPWRKGLDRSFVVSGFEAPLSSANLDISIPTGVAYISGYRIDVPGSTTVTCGASTTNYIWLVLTRDGLGKVNGAVFRRNAGTEDADSVLIRVCITSGTAITDTIDARQQLPHTMGGWFGLYNTGSGSSLAMNGYSIISSNTSLGGLNLYGALRLKAGVTLALTGRRAIILYAERTIEIAGTIDAARNGGLGGIGGVTPTDGQVGTDQPGGGGGGDNVNAGGSGGNILAGGCFLHAGGGSGVNANGTDGSTVSGAELGQLVSLLSALSGGSGGGGGRRTGGGTGSEGGIGGGSIVLIAPTIILRSTAVLDVSGQNGVAASGGSGGGGGGGGAGNIWICCRAGQFIDQGATFTMTGGSGGVGAGGAAHTGGNGAAGQKQIMLFY